MTTIISQKVGQDATRRCDAKCHQAAPGTHCDCICSGRYHSTGSSEQAARDLEHDLLAGELGPELREAAWSLRAPVQQSLVGA